MTPVPAGLLRTDERRHGALGLGQKAKLRFDIVDDGVKSVEVTDISCY